MEFVVAFSAVCGLIIVATLFVFLAPRTLISFIVSLVIYTVLTRHYFQNQYSSAILLIALFVICIISLSEDIKAIVKPK